MKATFLLLFTFFCSKASANFPVEKIPQCPVGDTKCILNTINENVFKHQSHGVPEINLVPVEPFHADKLIIENGGNSPVRIKLYFTNLTYFGFGNAKFRNLEGLGENINGTKFSFEIESPAVVQLATYKINGQVLILPIQGEGQSNMTFVRPVLHYKTLLKQVERNGEVYAQIDKAKMLLKTDRLIMNFSNLFNGNKELGDNMNLFLNENWKDIFNEIKLSVEKAFAKVMKKAINDVFMHVPYKQLFAQK